MTEWKKAKKTVEFREPEPNTHEWKYVGRTPQGGLAGGDDVHECKLCGANSLDEDWNGYCNEAEKKGKTEAVRMGWEREYGCSHEIIGRAIVGQHLIVNDGNELRVVGKKEFLKTVEVIEE